jgi:hypothetical protein
MFMDRRTSLRTVVIGALLAMMGPDPAHEQGRPRAANWIRSPGPGSTRCVHPMSAHGLPWRQ